MGESLFSQIAATFFIIELIVMLTFSFAVLSYYGLYEERKKPKYPITPVSQMKSFADGSITTKKYFFTPLFMWKIIFERHNDKKLNTFAKRARLSFFLFIAVGIIQLITFITLFQIGIL